MSAVKRLQGTDGVRGLVATENDPRLDDGPVAAFSWHGLITPQFARLYGAAFVVFLQKYLGRKTPNVVIGCDPRDSERKIVDALISGLVAAGAEVNDLGILPTPAIPLFMVKEKLDGGVMITASHNPADQNGIKLFLPENGGKLFPHEDELLTALLYQFEKEVINPGSAKTTDKSVNGRKLFLETMRDKKNSWLNDSFEPNEIALVVDSANGACLTVVRDIFDSLDLRFTDYVGMKEDGSVNDNCGAGLYEGVSLITEDFQASGGRDFRSVDLIQSLFRHGQQHREAIRQGEFRLCGAAFDGDGDRFYGLEYDPFKNAVTITSGDEIAWHQAAFIAETGEDSDESIRTVATTIESDIAVSSALEELDYIPVLCGVGDKWLLWEAQCSLFSTAADILEAELETTNEADEVEQIREKLEEMSEPDAIRFLDLLKEIEALAAKGSVDLTSKLDSLARHTFILGSEETGHSVTATFVPGHLPIYSGNGIKSCLNYLAASSHLNTKLRGEDFYRKLHQPYKPGIKATLPVYYTDKSRMLPGNEERSRIERLVSYALQHNLPGDMYSSVLPRQEEPGLLFFAIYKRQESQEDSIVATIFCRNSGTEAKTSLYLRAPGNISDLLLDGLEALFGEIAVLLIDKNNPYAVAEIEILNKIVSENGLESSSLPTLPDTVNIRRLLVEMTLKQQLVFNEGSVLRATERGKSLLAGLRKGN